MAVGEIDAVLGAGVAVDGNGVDGMVVGGTPVGETAVGGAGVGGTGVGEAVRALGASATGVGCSCVPKGSSDSVGPHPIAIIVINTRTISFMALRPLCCLAPSNADQCLRLEYYKVLPSNYLSSISVPLGQYRLGRSEMFRTLELPFEPLNHA